MMKAIGANLLGTCWGNRAKKIPDREKSAMKPVRAREVPVCALLLLSLVVLRTCRAQSDVNAGAKTFSTNCSGCHGSDGRGGERAPSIATARNVSSLSDQDLKSIVQHGVPGAGMPSFSFLGDQGITDVVGYLRVLQGKRAHVEVKGDASAGHDLFFGAGGCSSCHMMHGQGGFLGSDLSAYGADVSPDVARKAMLEKPDFVPAGSEIVEIRTASGRKLSGVLRSEDNFGIVVQDTEGNFQRFNTSRLKRLTHTGRTLMPTDYGTRLSPRQVDDLVSYLLNSARTGETLKRPRKQADE